MAIKCILAPVPQLKWGHEHAFINLSPSIFLGPLTPQIRRKMLNDAKQKNGSDSVLRVTLESEHVIAATVQATVPEHESESRMLNAALYTYVVDLALNRFVDLLRLVDDVPDCFDRSCWYTADGDPGEESTAISLGDPNWVSPPAYASGVHPGIGLAFFVHDDWKSRVPELLRIDELDGLFATFLNDPTVGQEAHTFCEKRIEEFLRIQASEELGVPPEEVTIEYDEPKPWPGRKHALPRTIRVGVPAQYVKEDQQERAEGDIKNLYMRWFVEGSMEIYRTRLRDAERKRYIDPAQSRFLRAYQAFTNSFRMDDPFRYVARATCLEALLGLGSAELTYQLASRAGWLLKPSDSDARYALCKDVRSYYNLRSKIVHGGTYKLTDLDDHGAKLLALARKLLWKIIFDDRLRKVFFEAGKQQCDEFLRRLSIGCAGLQETGPA